MGAVVLKSQLFATVIVCNGFFVSLVLASLGLVVFFSRDLEE